MAPEHYSGAHLPKIFFTFFPQRIRLAVFSRLRTNFAEMPGNRS
jgi:hypothetical protein